MPAKDFAYGSVVATSLGLDDAVAALRAALAEAGWGVLCEIDVAQMLHDKIGADFPPYRIVGACHPRLALEALGFEEYIGLLMPCNFVVESGRNGTHVSVVNARELFRATNNGMIFPLADRVDEQLADVLARIPA